MEKKRNLWVIPTDKPSRLILRKDNKFILRTPITQWHGKNQNIYITNSEEIKVGYHVFNTKNNHYGGVVNKNNLSDARLLSYIKKIILTTDQDLIKDGVQAIDDEFLEWFVKNPSCEKADFRLLAKLNKSTKKYEDFWEIIIPKEEPKPVWKQIIEDCGGKEAFMEAAGLKPKQETLEEFAKQEAIKQYSEDTFGNLIVRKSIEKGAKWQQEQDKKMYSDEEVKEIVYNMVGELAYANNMTFNGAILDELFNQFKNK